MSSADTDARTGGPAEAEPAARTGGGAETGGARPAPEANAAEEPLFTAAYDVDYGILERYARLNVVKQQRALVALIVSIDFAVAVMFVSTEPTLWPVSLVMVLVGAALLVWRWRSPSIAATRILKHLAPGKVHRAVEIYGDRATLTAGDGTSHTYPMDAFTALRWDDKTDVAVLVFGEHGITVPKESLTKGSWGDLLVWGEQHRVGAAQSAD